MKLEKENLQSEMLQSKKMNTEEIQTEESKIEESKTEESKTEESKTEESKTEESKIEDTKIENTKKEAFKKTDTKEKTSRNASDFLRPIFALFTVVCAVLIAGIISYSFSQTMVKDFNGMTHWLNPMSENVADFRGDSTYQEMVQSDVRELMEFLAVTSQLVTNGQFDTTKKVDVIAYANRKERVTSEALSKMELVYTIGDLIQWNGEGFDLPLPEEISDWYNVTRGEYEEDGERMTVSITEPYLPTDGVSLYERELPEGVTFEEVSEIIRIAANDLSINYARYNEQAEAYEQKDDLSLKYAMCDSNNTILYSNLPISGKMNAEWTKAFEQSYSFMKYHYASNSLEKNGIDNSVFSEIDAKTMFHKYRYLFPNGGTIYIAIDMGEFADKSQPSEISKLGAVKETDVYPAALSKYSQIGLSLQNYIIVAIILAVAYFLFAVCYTIVQPKQKKGELIFWDKGFTEIVAGIEIVIGIAIFAIFLAMIDMLQNDFMSNQVISGIKYICLVLIIAVFVLQTYFICCYGSLVRRIKAGVLWKNSIAYFILSKAKIFFVVSCSKFKKLCLAIVNHPSLLVRSILPYFLFLLLNLVAVLLLGPVGIILMAIFDLVVGYLLFADAKAKQDIIDGISKICEGELDYEIDKEALRGENYILADSINQIGTAVKNAVEQSRKDERLKAELITNVSHDIKTPLTSIINYVDLLKKENIENEKARQYIAVLDQKSQRLKQLTLDLVEASKITTGNIQIEYTDLNLLELMTQAVGEYEGKFLKKNLEIVMSQPKESKQLLIHADSRHTWRIIDNLLGNICKYAMEHTRVYIDVESVDDKAVVTLKNISKNALNIPVEELFQRFKRGDESRSTEGSGLGLSIAQSLAKAQGGDMKLLLDGDLFKVVIEFDKVP